MRRKVPAVLIVCVLLTILSIAGCVEPESYPEIVTPPAPPPSPALTLPRYSIVGKSVQGRPILCITHGQGDDVIFILATIHGNEPAGTPLVRRLREYLQQNPHLLAGRQVVLMPLANPDGRARDSRFNVRGVDLNRNFATANRRNNPQSGRAALSEPEARAIEQVIRQYSPDRIVSIHQPLTCIDYDGPGLDLAQRMAHHCSLPVKKLGARPGSLGSYAGLTLGIPIITLELPGDASQLGQEALWQQYGKALLTAIVYPSTVR